eukprot:GHVU01124577.1.p1 GENE.GHVU01124577.1~~GHVU01124577.1.p1  ORF type:complete len:140 (-),score=25.70 GHVU01124577.1:346-765(-)
MATRHDGFLDVFDLQVKHNDAALRQKVSTHPLTCASPHPAGSLVAVGDERGRVSVVRLSEVLSECSATEKLSVAAAFERETRKQKSFIDCANQAKAAAEAAAKTKIPTRPTAKYDEEDESALTKTFLETVGLPASSEAQ